MYYPKEKEFIQLTKKGNLIAVYKQINAGSETPLSALLKVRNAQYAFLFESVEGGEKIARYSFLGTNPAMVVRCKARSLRIEYPHKSITKKISRNSTFLKEIKALMLRYKAVPLKGLPRFSGGMVGYLAYDTVRFIENIPDKNPDSLKMDDAVFMLADTIAAFDHLKKSLKIISHCFIQPGSSLKNKMRLYKQAIRKIEALHAELKGKAAAEKRKTRTPQYNKPTSNMSKAGFEARVRKAKEYIRIGEIIQVVLSQRFKIKTQKSLFDIYRDLRTLNPSPYMFFLKLKDFSLIGSSPEMLVRCEGDIVRTRPIAGTRPRSKDKIKDRKFARDLLQDEKERAEHLMLVDLGRNDLGRVCLPAQVRVSEFMQIERYSHVMHLVSEVTGMLDKKRFDVYDVLSACFPAGTVSGSPKIRAMEIIDELENTRRGPYAGCVGYFSFSHNMDTCITIRTAIIKGDSAYVQAGAGIVADSVPRKEFFESLSKAKAVFEAIRK